MAAAAKTIWQVLNFVPALATKTLQAAGIAAPVANRITLVSSLCDYATPGPCVSGTVLVVAVVLYLSNKAR